MFTARLAGFPVRGLADGAGLAVGDDVAADCRVWVRLSPTAEAVITTSPAATTSPPAVPIASFHRSRTARPSSRPFAKVSTATRQTCVRVVPDAIAPDGSEITFLVGDARKASLVEVRLPAGSTSKPVRHRTVEEIWYFLAGEGRVWRSPPAGPPMIDEVRAGGVLVIPTGWAFQFRAGPDSDLRFLCYTSPPWPGDDEAVPLPAGGL